MGACTGIGLAKAIAVLSKKSGAKGTYIGRNGMRYGEFDSPLANPFPMASEADRDAVIEQYRLWLWKEVKRGEGKVWDELIRLLGLLRSGHELKLVCWCAPRKCHGDVIKACLLWMLREGIGN
jgi:Domain of unknown function (DUF4326)